MFVKSVASGEIVPGKANAEIFAASRSVGVDVGGPMVTSLVVAGRAKGFVARCKAAWSRLLISPSISISIPRGRER